MKTPGWLSLVVSLLLAPAAPASAAGDPTPDGLTPLGAAVVVEVVDGDTVVLDRAVRGTRRVRLVGLQAPKLPLGRPGFPTWPLADDSKQALAALVLDKRVTLAHGGTSKDRHGRLLAHLTGPTGAWVQGAMLEAGMARVYTFPDNRALAARMLAAERRARLARRGIWGDPFYAIRTPTNAARHVGTFQLVQGRVLDVARVKSRVYLNFGPDWRTDFTITLDARARRLFKKAGLDPMTLKDRSVRVRGWLKRRNGPAIEATHPEQIEVLAD